MDYSSWLATVTLVGLGGFLYFLAGIFLWRGKRMRAVKFALADLFITFLVLLAVTAIYHPPKLRIKNDAVAAGSPVTTSAETSNTPQSNVQSPPDAFCHWVSENERIEREADREFGASPDDDQFVKKHAWRQEKLKPLAKDLSVALGMELSAILATSEASYWALKCEALAKKLEALTLSDVRSTVTGDAQVAKDALLMQYVLNIGDGKGDFYDKGKFNSARCETMVQEQVHFVGCQLFSLSQRSGVDWYVVGKVGHSVVVGLMNREILESRFGSARDLPTSTGSRPAQLGMYVEFPVPEFFVDAERELKELMMR